MTFLLWGGVIAKVFYYGASYCVPGFFLLAGYLISKKGDLTVEYCEEKICKVSVKLFGWIVLWSAIHFVRTGEILDVWNQYLQGAGSGGLLPVAWFLFTYELLVLISYPLYRCSESKYGKYALMIIDAILIALLAFDFGHRWMETRTQSLWLHLYFTYFLSGMVIAMVDNVLSGKLKKIVSVTAIVPWAASALIYWHNVNVLGGAPHQHYGKGYYSVWLISFFIMIRSCSKWDIPDKIKKVINLCAVNTFTIYLGHLPLLIFITEYRPLSGVLDAVVCIVFLFCGLIIVAELFKRMPLLRKIV